MCALALQKFGPRLYVARDDVPDEGQASEFAKRILGDLNKAQKLAEREILQSIGKDQVASGHVTIRNQHGWLREVYEYFLDSARLAFDGQGRLSEQHPQGGWWFMRERREGAINTIAMVTAYFSLLEHVLVLSLPFTNDGLERQGVMEFIGERWAQKFKSIFDLNSDADAKRLYDRLCVVSETWRNTYGHGGFDKNHAAVWFHIPGVGQLPVVLSGIRDSPHFELVPVKETDFKEICALFEAVDSWLASVSAIRAMMWIKEGLDVPFDPEFRSKVRGSMEEFEEFLRYTSYQVDMATNMDW